MSNKIRQFQKAPAKARKLDTRKMIRKWQRQAARRPPMPPPPADTNTTLGGDQLPLSPTDLLDLNLDTNADQTLRTMAQADSAVLVNGAIDSTMSGKPMFGEPRLGELIVVQDAPAQPPDVNALIEPVSAEQLAEIFKKTSSEDAEP